MRMMLVLVLGLTLFTAPDARSQLEVGESVPPIEVSQWFNHGAVQLGSLEGQVVAIAFVRLDQTDSLFFLETWQEIRDELSLSPVTFISVTDESLEIIQEAIEIEDVDSPIVLNPSDAAAKEFAIQLYPSVFIQDPRGKICFYGQPGSKQQIKDAIVEALRFARYFPEMPKKARDVQRFLDRWELGRALEAIDTSTNKKLEPEEIQVLNDTRALIEALTKRIVRYADLCIENEDWPYAVVALTRLSEEHAGIPGAEGAAAKLEELLATEELKKEVLAAQAFAKGERYEREENWKSAQRQYDSVSKQYPDTKAGEQAAGLASLLESRVK